MKSLDLIWLSVDQRESGRLVFSKNICRFIKIIVSINIFIGIINISILYLIEYFTNDITNIFCNNN